MMQGQGTDNDRLPWLEPYREPEGLRPRLRSVEAKAPPAAKVPTAKTTTSGGRGAYALGAVGGLGLAALVGLIGYTLGRGEQAPAPSVSAPIAPAPVEPVRPKLDYPDIADGAAPSVLPAPVVSEPVRAPVAKAKVSVVPKRAVKTPPRTSTPRVAEQAPPPPTVAPPAPKPRTVVPVAPPPSAGKAGEVVRIGYYISARHAEAAYRRAKARYPYVGSLPKVVAPVEMQGRGTVYALRLGAGSKGNAKNACRYMKRVAISCTVE